MFSDSQEPGNRGKQEPGNRGKENQRNKAGDWEHVAIKYTGYLRLINGHRSPGNLETGKKNETKIHSRK